MYYGLCIGNGLKASKRMPEETQALFPGPTCKNCTNCDSVGVVMEMHYIPSGESSSQVRVAIPYLTTAVICYFLKVEGREGNSGPPIKSVLP
jgi:hypothetical protein